MPTLAPSVRLTPPSPVRHHRPWIDRLVAGPGPQPSDYPAIDRWIARLHGEVAAGRVSPTELDALRDSFGDLLSTATVQGFAYRKPHGYAGDFEIIDRIYRRHTAADPRLAAWDRYFHQQAATKAVRNRKSYFHRVLDRKNYFHHLFHHYAGRRPPLKVLNIASGPGRCMAEWLSAHPSADVTFDCIEIDPNAIAYAKRLNASFPERVTFKQQNALRFKPAQQYDLIWASGIFDYFTDSVFKALLRRLFAAVVPSGEVIVGNFTDPNPSRPYMELFGDWHLHHRSADALRNLALACDVPACAIRVGAEPEGVNLFLHLTHP